jgi:hypothetical protein
MIFLPLLYTLRRKRFANDELFRAYHGREGKLFAKSPSDSDGTFQPFIDHRLRVLMLRFCYSHFYSVLGVFLSGHHESEASNGGPWKNSSGLSIVSHSGLIVASCYTIARLGEMRNLGLAMKQ